MVSIGGDENDTEFNIMLATLEANIELPEIKSPTKRLLDPTTAAKEFEMLDEKVGEMLQQADAHYSNVYLKKKGTSATLADNRSWVFFNKHELGLCL
jgi:hypothetical protein